MNCIFTLNLLDTLQLTHLIFLANNSSKFVFFHNIIEIFLIKFYVFIRNEKLFLKKFINLNYTIAVQGITSHYIIDLRAFVQYLLN